MFQLQKTTYEVKLLDVFRNYCISQNHDGQLKPTKEYNSQTKTSNLPL